MIQIISNNLQLVKPATDYTHQLLKVQGLLQQKLFFEDQAAGNHPSQSHYHLDSRDGSEPIQLGKKMICYFKFHYIMDTCSSAYINCQTFITPLAQHVQVPCFNPSNSKHYNFKIIQLFQMLSSASGSLLLIIFVIILNAALDRWQLQPAGHLLFTYWFVLDSRTGNTQIELSIFFNAGVNQGLNRTLFLEQEECITWKESQTNCIFFLVSLFFLVIFASDFSIQMCLLQK